jgi:hypothetical protein
MVEHGAHDIAAADRGNGIVDLVERPNPRDLR